MSTNIIKVTKEVVSCSDNGQHPLVYIKLKNGKGACQYCGQQFMHSKADADKTLDKAAA